MRRNLRRKDSNIFGMFTQEQLNNLREVFNMLDVDNDTFLTKSDLVAVSESIGNPFSEAQIEEMLDGKKISYMALLTMIGEKLSEIEPEASLLQALKEFSNGVSDIDEEELRYWLENEGDKMKREDVDFLLKDATQKGRVDYSRLAGIMKRGEVLEKTAR